MKLKPEKVYTTVRNRYPELDGDYFGNYTTTHENESGHCVLKYTSGSLAFEMNGEDTLQIIEWLREQELYTLTKEQIAMIIRAAVMDFATEKEKEDEDFGFMVNSYIESVFEV
jgi:hypothetical protein